MRQPGGSRQDPRRAGFRPSETEFPGKSPATARIATVLPWLIILNTRRVGSSRSHSGPVPANALLAAAVLPGPGSCDDRARGQPRLHHRKSTRRLRRRQMSRRRREVRRPRRPVLLRDQGFRARHRLSAGRPGRHHWSRSHGSRRPLRAARLRGIRRDHLPALVPPPLNDLWGAPETT